MKTLSLDGQCMTALYRVHSSEGGCMLEKMDTSAECKRKLLKCGLVRQGKDGSVTMTARGRDALVAMIIIDENSPSPAERTARLLNEIGVTSRELIEMKQREPLVRVFEPDVNSALNFLSDIEHSVTPKKAWTFRMPIIEEK